MGREHLNIGTLNLLFLIYTIFKASPHSHHFDWSRFGDKRVDTAPLSSTLWLLDN